MKHNSFFVVEIFSDVKIESLGAFGSSIKCKSQEMISVSHLTFEFGTAR